MSSHIAIANLLYSYAEKFDSGDLAGAAGLFRHARVKAMDGEVDHEGLLALWRSIVTIHPDGTPLTCAADYLFNPATWAGSGIWENYLAHNPQANPGGIADYLDQVSPHIGFWKANEVAPVFHNEQDYFAANTTTYNFSEDLLLKNIAGFSASNTHDLGSS